ncbi:MAG: hypothetical protein IJP66_08015 [Kiritimatiellae bacterium]|nr:hypothetical protein [Kiritimatiellia bacterium]
MFVGREEELKSLEALWGRDTGVLVTCRGRRRIGKSTLIGEFAAPPELARDIARETAAFLAGPAPVEMLEPSAGTGAFLSAFFAEPGCRVARALAVEADRAYLAEGVGTTSEKRLCAGRSLWYDQEQRKPAPILCSYLGRGDGAGQMIPAMAAEGECGAPESCRSLV